VIFVNWLANSLPIGGVRTGEVSALYESLFTPAGFTFAIWGVIYTSLLIYAIYQAMPGQNNSVLLRDVGRLFIVNSLLNCAWLFAWHMQLLLVSLLVMTAILLSLIMIYRRLLREGGVSLILSLPFSIYLAWICVATIANISAWQTAMELNDAVLSSIHWTLVKLAIAAAIGSGVVLLKRDIPFVLVVGWAAYGISVKQAAIPEVYGASLTLVAVTLILSAFTLARYSASITRLRLMANITLHPGGFFKRNHIDQPDLRATELADGLEVSDQPKGCSDQSLAR
jgi:hypothetical protein